MDADCGWLLLNDETDLGDDDDTPGNPLIIGCNGLTCNLRKHLQNWVNVPAYMDAINWGPTSNLARLTRKQLMNKVCSSWEQIPEIEAKSLFHALPAGLQECVLAKLPYENVYQLKAVSKKMKDFIESDLFLSSPPTMELRFNTVTLTAPYFFTKDGVWQCAGYDPALQKWRHLPPLTYLPADCMPDSNLFKEYLVCAKDGLLCMNVSKSDEERLIVFNLLTGKWTQLPPLNHRRNPVLMHLFVNATTQSYQIVVAGSARSGDHHFSRITEVFDSRASQWTRTGDLPGPEHALNEYQVGVCKEKKLYCIAHMDPQLGKGILQYDIEMAIWVESLSFPIPFSENSTLVQLVESRGEVHVFSEQVNGRSVYHCIDRLEWIDSEGDGACRLKSVVREPKLSGRSLESYPEYTCVGFGEDGLCIVNAIDHSGVVYDVWNENQAEVLQAPAMEGFGGQGLFCLNPLSFTIVPSFRSKV